MSDNPTTPDKSGDTGRTSPAMAGVPHTEASAATKVSQIEVEPSPASTYGVSAVGNSVPATPQDIEGKFSFPDAFIHSPYQLCHLRMLQCLSFSGNGLRLLLQHCCICDRIKSLGDRLSSCALSHVVESAC